MAAADPWAAVATMDDAPAPAADTAPAAAETTASQPGYSQDARGRLIVDVPGPANEQAPIPPQTATDPWGQVGDMDDAAPKAEEKPTEAAPTPVPEAHPATIGREAGIATRGAAEGLAGLGDLVTHYVLPGGFLLSQFAPSGEQIAGHLSDAAGLPTPEGAGENILAKGAGGIATGLATAGIAPGVGLIVSALSGGASAAASEAAKQAGYGAPAQIGAGLLAGAVPAAGAILAGRSTDTLADVAQRLGITPTPATTGGAVARLVQKGFGNLPGASAAVATGAHNEVEGLADAAHRAAAAIGTVGTRQSAGEAVVRGAQAFERGTKAAGRSLYRERDALMGGDSAPVSLDNTRQAYADIAAQFPTSEALKDLRQHPALRKLEAALPKAKADDPDAGLLTLGEATDALSHVRGVLRNLTARSQATPAITRRVAAVEQALEDDVNNAAAAADQATGRAPGAGSAVQAQADADAYWANRSRVLNGALKKPIASAKDVTKVSGEQVYNGLVSDMQRKGGNLARFQQTWNSLPRNARNTFAATLLDDMGRATAGAQNAAGDAWSFNTFLTNYDNLSPGARMVAFGGREQERTINDIARYAQKLREIGAGANHSNTASHGIAGAFLAGIGGALFHGDIHAAAGIAGTAAASYPAARLFMATPAMRLWTRDALRATAASQGAGGSPGAFTPLIRRLTTIAAADPAISAPVLDLQQRLSSGLAKAPVPVAADRRKDNR